jgi:hypothetical protein
VSQDFEQTAWAWVEHVRNGGTTPWLTWARTRSSTAASAGSARTGPHLPGAAELELVRRLGERHADSGGVLDFPALADLVLRHSGPGRGMGQLPLLWPEAAGRARGVGPPPTDPAQVPVDELLRVAVGALAALLVSSPPPPPLPRAPRRWPWSPQLRLAGAPLTTAAVRASLAAAGHAEGGFRPVVLLFAEPFDVHLGQVWSARVQRGAPVRWDTFVTRWAGSDVLPPAADVAAHAAYWAGRVGPDKVHVVVDADDAAAARIAAEVLGLRVGDATGRAVLEHLSPTATDLLRRLNRVLNVRVADDTRPALLRAATTLLRGEPGDPLAVPPRHLGWARERADRTAENLRAGGYAVHGDLTRIGPRQEGGVSHPRRRLVLDLGTDAVLALARSGAGHGREER